MPASPARRARDRRRDQEEPFGLPFTTPFREDRTHAAYDAEAASRFAAAPPVDQSVAVLEEYSGPMDQQEAGPVHFFWHAFDLAVTRLLREAPCRPLPG